MSSKRVQIKKKLNEVIFKDQYHQVVMELKGAMIDKVKLYQEYLVLQKRCKIASDRIRNIEERVMRMK